MNTTGMPALEEASARFNDIRTLDPDGGILTVCQCGRQRGEICVGHLWDPAADEQRALCKNMEY